MHGVYGLLEKLGCGFFLSFDTTPAGSKESFGLIEWDLANHPLTPVRTVFNWHNFLSGCSGWDLAQWQQWITRSQQCGFNSIMVHAYGNNPMFTFEFQGKPKPTGYLTTTRQGRDWSANHVNDVRRLHGGFLFTDPVFGSEAGKVADDQRVTAVQTMMRSAFAGAEQRGMKINFALDFDIPSCNPQELVLQLDEADRFQVGGVCLARPDTAAGSGFYQAQAKSLIETYPQIDTVTLWRRYDGYSAATWPVMKFGEMPAAWQEEYQAIVARDPAAGKLFQAVPAFGMAKVARVWRESLDALGRKDIGLATGSWKFPWLPAAARFFPETSSRPNAVSKRHRPRTRPASPPRPQP